MKNPRRDEREFIRFLGASEGKPFAPPEAKMRESSALFKEYFAKQYLTEVRDDSGRSLYRTTVKFKQDYEALLSATRHPLARAVTVERVVILLSLIISMTSLYHTWSRDRDRGTKEFAIIAYLREPSGQRLPLAQGKIVPFHLDLDVYFFNGTKFPVGIMTVETPRECSHTPYRVVQIADEQGQRVSTPIIPLIEPQKARKVIVRIGGQTKRDETESMGANLTGSNRDELGVAQMKICKDFQDQVRALEAVTSEDERVRFSVRRGMVPCSHIK